MALYDFDFHPSGYAYAVGWRGLRRNDTLWEFQNIVLRSTNNGINWNQEVVTDLGIFSYDAWQDFLETDIRNSTILLTVSCITSHEVVVSGNSSQMYRTTDAGENWFGYTTGWNTINEMLYENNSFLGGEWDALYKSTNAGLNWFRLSDTSMKTTTQALGIVGSKILVGGQSQEDGINVSYSYSTNEGESWVSHLLPDTGSFTDILFIDNDLGYATAHNPIDYGVWNRPRGFIYKTRDQGSTWEKLFEQEWIEMFAVCQTQEYVFFVGTGILKRLPLLMVSIFSEGVEKNNYILSQNYPNPFNPSTKIKFSIQSFGNVSLTVFDISGRLIQNLVNETKQPGNYEVEFNGAHLSSGTYLYKLQAGEYIETKRMTLIK